MPDSESQKPITVLLNHYEKHEFDKAYEYISTYKPENEDYLKEIQYAVRCILITAQNIKSSWDINKTLKAIYKNMYLHSVLLNFDLKKLKYLRENDFDDYSKTLINYLMEL